MRMSTGGVRSEQSRSSHGIYSWSGRARGWHAAAVVSQFRERTMKSTMTAHNSCKARLDTGRYRRGPLAVGLPSVD